MSTTDEILQAHGYAPRFYWERLIVEPGTDCGTTIIVTPGEIEQNEGKLEELLKVKEELARIDLAESLALKEDDY